MKSRRMVVSGLMLFTMMGGLALSGSAPTSLAAAPAMLAAFTWTGADSGIRWDSGCNWHPAPSCSDVDPYPDDTGDNATFPWNSGVAWACDLVGEDIGNLTLEGNVDFDTAGGTVTLGLAKLTIAPTQGDVEITVSGTTIITVR